MDISDLERVVGTTLLKGEETVQTEAALGGIDLVLLYFSAHWCYPCRLFTRTLSHFYSSASSQPLQLQVIFVSCDQDLLTFQAYSRPMPWLAVDYAEKGRRERLCKDFNATCVPKLVLIGRDGTFRSDSCRGDVETMEVGPVLEKWSTALHSSA